MMTKKAQVVMLPTEKASTLCITDTGVLGMYPSAHKAKYGVNQHLYFTTHNEIKEGDWVIAKNSNLLRLEKVKMVNHLGNNSILLDSGYDVTPNTLLKIVATTNPDLYIGGIVTLTRTGDIASVKVARIPDDFIEAYVREQGKIKEVLIEYEEY